MRTVISATALIAATYGLARFGYGLFLPQLSTTFHLGRTAAGFIPAGSFVSYCFASMLASRMSAHPRRTVMCAGGAATVGSLGVAVSPDLLVLALSVNLAGAGAGFASPGLVTLVERNVPTARQESAQTIVNAGTGAGIVVAGMLMFLTLGHWRLGWLTISTVVLLSTVAVLHADGTAGSRRGRSLPRMPTRTGDLARLTWPVIAAAMAGVSSAAVWTFGPSIMTDAQSRGDRYATVAWMMLGAFGVLGASAGKIVQTWNLKSAWTLTCVATATATVLLGLAPGWPLVAFAAVATFGAGYTAMSGVLILWAVRVTPEQQAAGTVVLFISLAVGQALGSAGVGLVQGVAAPTVTFTVAGVVGLLAVLPALPAQAETCP